MALFIGWLSFKIKKETQEWPWQIFFQSIASLFLASNFMFFYFAISAFHAGLTKIEKHLFDIVVDDIK